MVLLAQSYYPVIRLSTSLPDTLKDSLAQQINRLWQKEPVNEAIRSLLSPKRLSQGTVFVIASTQGRENKNNMLTHSSNIGTLVKT